MKPCAYTVPVPFERIVLPGGDTQLVGNIEYRITIAGPVALAPFMDFGLDPIIRPSQLQDCGGTIGHHQQHTVRLSCARLRAELPGRTIHSLRWSFAAGCGHQLGAANVNRPGTADVSSGNQRSVPHLLGLQPFAPGYDGGFADQNHSRYVPSRRCRGLYLPERNRFRLGELPPAGAA